MHQTPDLRKSSRRVVPGRRMANSVAQSSIDNFASRRTFYRSFSRIPSARGCSVGHCLGGGLGSWGGSPASFVRLSPTLLSVCFQYRLFLSFCCEQLRCRQCGVSALMPKSILARKHHSQVRHVFNLFPAMLRFMLLPFLRFLLNIIVYDLIFQK